MAAEPDAGAATGRGLVLRLGGDRLLVPVDVVREVIAAPPATPLPLPAPHLRGVTTHRGRIVPVWHTAGLLGVEGDAEPAEAVVVTVAGADVALLVEGVHGLAVPTGPRGPSRAWWARGTVQLQVDDVTRTVALLDPAALAERIAS